jgi:RND family efflux transporter MFP subunit
MAPMVEAQARRMRSILAIAGPLVVALLVGTWALHRWAENKRAVKPDLSKPAGVAQTAPTAAAAEEAQGGFVGVILSRQAVQIAPKFEGPLASVKVRMGDEVQQGEVIAVLDTAALRKELAVAEAVVLAAQSDERKVRAELEELKLKLDTAKRIEKYVSAAEIAGIESQYHAGIAKVESSQATKLEKRARVRQLQETLSNTELRAPFAGVVAARYADPGANVSQTKPVIRLVSDDRFIRFAVPEEHGSTVHIGQEVSAVVDSQKLLGSGVVEKVAPEVDSASGTIFVEASLNEGAKLKNQLPSGSVARVLLK